MSLFNDDIIQQSLYTKQVYDIHIEYFSPNLFYKWIWEEKSVKYPPHYPKSEGVSYQLLYDIIVDKLGEIPADDFIKWNEEFVKNKSIKHFRRYFKKLIKREYMPHVSVVPSGEDILFCMLYRNIQMTIIFQRK